MKKHLGNLGLLLALFTLLAVPLATFKFITYTQTEKPRVLGDSTVKNVRKDDDDREKDEQKKEHVFLHPSNVVRFFR